MTPVFFARTPAQRLIVGLLIALQMLPPALITKGAWAQAANYPINPDKSVPGQRPVVNVAGNGVPIVQIAPPSAAGVSHNRFTDFNVGPNGAILNNSGASSQTQLGGWIGGNPMLGNSSARTILNEVTGHLSSRLHGYTEVAGNRANVIIANPNGISCDGCGFINAARGSLTTGRPDFANDGSVAGFNVDRGQIDIDGQGLNGRNVDRIDLISRSLRVNADLWAGTLDVVTGTNHVDYDSGDVTQQVSSGTAPAVAIDVSQLGGMYANSIRMIGTETGVGVNSAGTIAALTGELTVSSAGDVRIVEGQVQAAGNVNMRSAQDIINAGTIYAGATAAFAASGKLENTNVIAAATNVQGDVAALDNTGTLAAGVDEEGQITYTGDVSIAASNALQSSGRITAGNKVELSGKTVMLDGGELSANGDAVLSASGMLSHVDGKLVADSVLLNAESLDNQQGSILQTGADGRLGIYTQQGIDNDNGRIAANASDVTLTGKQLHNAGGTIEHAGAGTLAIHVDDAIDNAQGTIVSNGDASMQAANVANTEGNVQAQGNITLDLADGAVDNSSGLIRSGGQLAVTADTIVNTGTQGDDKGVEGADLTLTAAIIDNTSGAIRSDEQLAIAVTDVLDNTQGSVSSGKAATVHAATVTNTDGMLIAGQNLEVASQNLSGDGKLLSHGDMAIALDGDFNNIGQVQADNDLDLQIQGALVNNGLIHASETLDLDATTVTNQTDGEISADATLVTVAGQLDNGGLIDGSLTRVEADAINNTGRIYGDHIAVQADSLTNDTSGVIAARDGMALGVGSLVNREHALIYSGGELHVGGSLDADNQAAGTANSITNASATIEASGNMVLSTGSLINRNDHFSMSTKVAGVGHVTEYQPRGWSSRLAASSVGFNGIDKGRLVVDSSVYPLAVYGAAPIRSALVEYCDGAECTPTYSRYYSLTDPVWTRFSVDAPPVSAPAIPSICYFIFSPECQEAHKAYSAWVSGWDGAYLTLNSEIQKFNSNLRSRMVEDWYVYNYTRTTSENTVQTSDPAQIRAGGNLTLSGSVTNDKSQMIAGGTINGSIVSINNIDAQGKRTISDSGTVEFTELVSCGWDDHCRRWRGANTYNPASNVQTIGLPVARIESNVSVDVGMSLPAANMDGVDLTAAGAQQVAGIDAPPTAGQNAPPIPVPDSALFATHPEPDHAYLVETDPRFADHRTWLSSDFMLEKMNRDPSKTLKRLGDGFYEQKLVAEQVMLATGQRFIGGHTSNEAQYLALMQAGVEFAEKYQLNVGTALSEEQMKLLTTDIVWLVERDVTLPDGSVQTVLVPQVYARVDDGDLKGDGTLMAGNEIRFDVAGDINNSATIVGHKVNALVADNINNLGGSILGEDIDLNARVDLNNLSGTIAGDQIALHAGRDINIATRTIASAGETGTRTGDDRAAVIRGENISATSGRDLTIAGARLESEGDVILLADRNATVDAVRTESTLDVAPSGHIREQEVQHVGSDIRAGGDLTIAAGLAQDGDLTLRGSDVTAEGELNAIGTNVRVESAIDSKTVDIFTKLKHGTENIDEHVEGAVGGKLAAGEGTTVVARGRTDIDGNAQAGTGDLVLKGAEIGSEEGDITLAANNDVDLEQQQLAYSRRHETTYKGGSLTAKKSRYSLTDEHSTQSIGTTVSGASVQIGADHDITAKAATVVATEDVALLAGNDIHIGTAEDTSSRDHIFREKKSGLFSGGGLSVTLGKQQIDREGDSQETTHTGSQIASLEGNLVIDAGRKYEQTGSDVLALAGDIDISAQQVDINAAIDTHANRQKEKTRQSGLTLSVSNPVISAVETVGQMAEAAEESDDPRMKALAAATAAMSVKNAADTVAKNPQGMGGTKITLSIGSSKSESSSTQQAEVVTGSRVIAGGDLSIQATGAGTDSNLTVIGSDIRAGNNAILAADNRIDLSAAQNVLTEHRDNKSSGASIGIGFAMGGSQNGFTVELAANQARGNADGTDISHVNTHVSAGNTVVLDSGGDTTLKGATVSGDTVHAQVGGDLQIESLQDSSQFDSKQKNSGFSASVCVPPFCYGSSSASVSIGKSNVQGDYLSVTEQSGIQTGDGGFNVTVEGNTDLKGGVIASTQSAIDDNKNRLVTGTLTTSDLHNHDVYEAGGYSLSGSISGKLGDQSSPAAQSKMSDADKVAADYGRNPATPGASAGFGSASGSRSSVTRSGISGGMLVIANDAEQQILTGRDSETALASLNTDITTASDTGALAKAWNGKQLQEQVQAQITITQAFSQVAPKAVGDYAQRRREEAAAMLAQAEKETDPAKQEALRQRALELEENWKEGGAARVALHAAVGALAGGLEGGIGAGATALTTPALVSQINQLDAPQEIKDALLVVAGTAVGAATGGSAGAAAGASQVVNNYLNHQQWEDYAKERGECKDSTCRNEVDQRYRALGAAQDAQLAQCGATGNCESLIAEVHQGTQTMLNLVRDGQLPQSFAGAGDLQYMGQKLASSQRLRESVAKAIEITQHCEANPAQCDRQALNIAIAVAGATLGGGATVVLLKNASQIAAAAKMGLQACLANVTLCANRAAIAGAEIVAGDAVGGAALATPAAVATGKAVAKALDEVAAARNAANSVPRSPVDIAHAIGADYTKAGKPTGGHSLLNGDVQIVPGTESLPDASGVYKATIQVPDPQNPGQWLTKTSNNSTNSMFPKNWDAARIQLEVDAAWNSPNKVVNGSKWSSFTPSGVKVEGFISPRTTVYPVYQP